MKQERDKTTREKMSPRETENESIAGKIDWMRETIKSQTESEGERRE